MKAGFGWSYGPPPALQTGELDRKETIVTGKAFGEDVHSLLPPEELIWNQPQLIDFGEVQEDNWGNSEYRKISFGATLNSLHKSIRLDFVIQPAWFVICTLGIVRKIAVEIQWLRISFDFFPGFSGGPIRVRRRQYG